MTGAALGHTVEVALEQLRRKMRREGLPIDDSYTRLVEAHRAELQSHCQRMLGSADDAEDALQETLVRAWKGFGSFEGRGSLRGWLYRIATNASLDVLRRRDNRLVRIDAGHVAGPYDRSDGTVEIQDDSPGPEIRYEQRESVKFALEAAQRLLTPTQRTVLILREALGYSAAETADVLDTSVASVNSALQRARGTLERRAPERHRLDVRLRVSRPSTN
jgi:RNA polymerase sigma-70 factor, ECF subfamily